MNEKITEKFNISQDGVLSMKGTVCVPNVEDFRILIMEKAP